MMKDHEWSLAEAELDLLVKRLRKSKDEAVLENRNAGIKDGVEWARACASYKALEFLRSAVENSELDFLTAELPGLCLAERMAEAMGYDPDNQWAAQHACEELFGDCTLINSSAFVQGFVEGSLRVWFQIRTRV